MIDAEQTSDDAVAPDVAGEAVMPPVRADTADGVLRILLNALATGRSGTDHSIGAVRT